MKRKTVFALLFALTSVLALPSDAPGGILDGSCLEAWELTNHQSASPTYQQNVHSASYRARTTVVVLLASW